MAGSRKKIGSGIEIKGNYTEGKREPQPVSALLFLLAGVLGILFFFHTVDGVSFSGRVVYLTAVILCGAIWCIYFYWEKMFLWFIFLISAVTFISAFLLQESLQLQLVQIYESILHETETENFSVTGMAVILTIAVVVLFFVIEIVLKDHLFLYMITSLLMLLSPLAGIRPEVETVFGFLIFQGAFWVLQGTGGRKDRTVLSLYQRSRLSGKSICAAVFLILLLFIPAFFYAVRHADDIYDKAYEAEGYIYRSRKQSTGEAAAQIRGGKINIGNNYRTGTGHLEIQADLRPTQTLYLRGFGGGEYIGGDWIRSSDEELFPDISEEMKNLDPDLLALQNFSVRTLYYNMYFEMNSHMQREDGESPAPVTITVRHYNGDYQNAYVPYYTERRYQNRDSYSSVYSSTASLNEGYTYQFYEQKDMNIEWDNVAESYEGTRDRYQILQEAYLKAAQTAYTKVPTEIVPRLVRLVEENPLKSREEITAFILYTLHSNAVYTLTPGRIPFNRDPAEYFLFESGRGFCEHFALTATLLYRLYGIPARYATGYMVSPSDFVQTDDSFWLAKVTDEAAHAWVEIFLEDYGWTPVEVTPASDGSTVASYPGFDGLTYRQELGAHNWNAGIPGITSGETEAGAYSDPDWIDNLSLDFHFELSDRAKWILISVSVYTVLLIPFFFEYRRLYNLNRFGRMDCRLIFDRLVRMLHANKILDGYDGTEEDFAGRFSSDFPDIPETEVRHMQEIVSKASFGRQTPSWEEEEFVRRIYFKAADHIYSTLKWNQKLVFRYFRDPKIRR